MSNNSLQHEIAAAIGYEDLLVSALSQQWVVPVIEAARIQPVV